MGILWLSGTYLAGTHVGSWVRLSDTDYGLALQIKIGLALLALGLGAINLLIIKPRLQATARAETARQYFGRILWAEAILALCILPVVGILADLQRSQDAPL